MQENFNSIKALEQATKQLIDNITYNNNLLLKYSKAMPIPFGRFFIDTNGNLNCTLYGVAANDTLRITEDGMLQLEVNITEE